MRPQVLSRVRRVLEVNFQPGSADPRAPIGLPSRCFPPIPSPAPQATMALPCRERRTAHRPKRQLTQGSSQSRNSPTGCGRHRQLSSLPMALMLSGVGTRSLCLRNLLRQLRTTLWHCPSGCSTSLPRKPAPSSYPNGCQLWPPRRLRRSQELMLRYLCPRPKLPAPRRSKQGRRPRRSPRRAVLGRQS